MSQLFDDNETLPVGLSEDKYTVMRKLVDEIKKYSRSYYVDNVSLISDYEFDMKFKELQKMEEDLNFAFDDSPTKRVGSDLQDGFKEAKHEIQMGSVENCYDYPSIVKYFTNIWNDYKKNPSNSANVDFYKNYPCFLIIEPKFDGLSCSLIYQYGHLVQASTRGNGFIGSDITENIKYVSGVPQYIPMMARSARFEVRGEVLMPKSTFTKLNEERLKNGDKLFANARNAASGSLKQLDPLVTKERGLIFMPYNAFCKDDLHFSPFGSYNRYNENEIVCYLLPTMGFNTFPYILCNVEQLEAALEAFKEKIFTNQDYCMDGAVVKLNSWMMQDEMGYDKKCPDWCRAMKWKQESTCATTILRNVEWTVGKTGKVTPTAVFDACNINGSEITRATLNNVNYIKDLDLHINDRIIVQKAGEVIPQIIGKSDGRDSDTHYEIQIPKVCPDCGEPLTTAINVNGEEGVHLYCTNETNCPGIQKQKLIYYCSKECMDIDGLGDQTIEHLYNRTLLRTWKDIYYLNECDLVVVGGYTSYSAKKVINSIKFAVEHASPAQLLYSIGINGIGKKSMEKVLDIFGSFENIKNTSDKELLEKLVNECGNVKGTILYKWFIINGFDAMDFYSNWKESVKDKDGIDLKDLNFNTVSNTAEAISDKLAGKTFLATGTLENYSREGIEECVESHGGKWMSGVSKNLDYLIAGAKAGSKLDKANKLGITILSEDDFVKMIS